MISEIRGIHVAAMFGTAFAVIVGVNAVLATQAVRTFPGLEVKNSYVASQVFDAERAAQEALGWTASVHVDRRRLVLSLTAGGGPAPARITEARAGRATFAAEDRRLTFSPSDEGYVADAHEFEPGRWYLWLAASAPDGTPFRQRLEFWLEP